MTQVHEILQRFDAKIKVRKFNEQKRIQKPMKNPKVRKIGPNRLAVQNMLKVGHSPH